jgi:hypothetical protein
MADFSEKKENFSFANTKEIFGAAIVCRIVFQG